MPLPPGGIPGPVVALVVGVLGIIFLLALFGRGGGGKKR